MALAQRGVTVEGIDAAFLGSVTMRAGLSSSAAVEMAFAVAWQALGGWTLPCAELAQAGREAERSYMGLGTGIQDQFTVLCAERDRGFYLDCRSLETETLPLPADARVVVCDTLTRRELVGSSYNSRSADCKAAVSIIAAEEPSVRMLRDVPLDLLQAFEPRLTADQFRRSRHVVTEIARVAEGRERLLAGDLAAFGALMNRSYFSARNDYGSSSRARRDVVCGDQPSRVLRRVTAAAGKRARSPRWSKRTPWRASLSRLRRAIWLKPATKETSSRCGRSRARESPAKVYDRRSASRFCRNANRPRIAVRL